MGPRDLVLTTDIDNIVEHVLESVRARAPNTWLQARRKSPLSFHSRAPSVRALAERHIRGVPELAVRALRLIDAGFPVEVSTSVPTADHVLALQAEGRRCVSLLRGDPGPGRPDPLEFALHDLCHLAKFAGGEFYTEQVGFFCTLERALSEPAFHRLENDLDLQWRADRQHVGSDMNGSSVFLFAVLKMKLKMAARRQLARRSGAPVKTSGSLDQKEQDVFQTVLATLLDAMHLSRTVRAAAEHTSARRDCPLAAAQLASAFREIGAARLAQAGISSANACTG